VRALGLFSGGLDSLLAVAVMQRMGFSVECVHFATGFNKRANREVVERCRTNPAHYGLEPFVLTPVDAQSAYLGRFLRSPQHGFGAGLNPCLDCRTFMLREADGIRAARGIELLFTGDVIGQRMMDQRRESMQRLDRWAEVEGRLFRPLCARYLPTPPALAGTGLDLSGLPSIQGRARRGQAALARELGLMALPTPSGGCCWLADKGYARRMRDALEHEADSGASDPEQLRMGRHFRLNWQVKAIVARNVEEDRALSAGAASSWLARSRLPYKGRVCRVLGQPSRELLARVASLAARYSAGREEPCVPVDLRRGSETLQISAPPASEQELRDWRI